MAARLPRHGGRSGVGAGCAGHRRNSLGPRPRSLLVATARSMCEGGWLTVAGAVRPASPCGATNLPQQVCKNVPPNAKQRTSLQELVRCF